MNPRDAISEADLFDWTAADYEPPIDEPPCEDDEESDDDRNTRQTENA